MKLDGNNDRLCQSLTSNGFRSLSQLICRCGTSVTTFFFELLARSSPLCLADPPCEKDLRKSGTARDTSGLSVYQHQLYLLVRIPHRKQTPAKPDLSSPTFTSQPPPPLLPLNEHQLRQSMASVTPWQHNN
jgi:hypothetical protein